MNGKQKLHTSSSEGCLESKIPKIDFAGKENCPFTRVYPKRKRTPSSKAFETLAQTPQLKSYNNKLNVATNPVKQVLSAINSNGSPLKSLDNVSNSVVDLEDVKGEKVKLKSYIENMPEKSEYSAARKVSRKHKDTTPDSKKVTSDKNKGKRCMPKTVDKRLEAMGIESRCVCKCLKSAMFKGYVTLTGDPSDLEQIIIEGEYGGHIFKVLLKDILYQPDYGGDYEDGSVGATATCSCCQDSDYPVKAYVTRLCQGKPELDCGKSHNHCRDCKKGFGICLNDYRMDHCDKCNKHWFSGLTGFPCDNCKKIRQQKRGLAGLFMMDDYGNSDLDDSFHSNECTTSEDIDDSDNSYHSDTGCTIS